MRQIFLNIPQKLMQLQNEILQLRLENKIELQNGDTGYASAPSNIALLKYWGKAEHKNQIPDNSSLSMTLGGFRSTTKATVLGRFVPNYNINESGPFQNQMKLMNEHGQIIEDKCSNKMNLFLNSILYPFANDVALHIQSQNSFPTACGIASSASGYAACVGALADCLQLSKHFSPENLQYWLSEWSRIGSGSATRSSLLHSKFNNDALFVAWKLNTNSTSTYAIERHKNWNDMRHCVCLINENKKSVSSTSGHKYANTSPLHAIRVAGMEIKFSQLIRALYQFDFSTLQKISEEDAFSMHAVMQTGQPPACYLNNSVAKIISSFINFRDKNKIKAFWTLDAGPNIHFLYLKEHEAAMNLFIELNNSNQLKVLHNEFGNEFLQLGKQYASK